LVDPHGPYDPPPPYDAWFRRLNGGSPVTPQFAVDPAWNARPTVEGRRALYDGEIAYNDLHIREFVDHLRATGLLASTALFFIADHGEHLGEHGLADHQASLDDHLVRVPFVAWGAGIVPGGRRAPTHEFVDVLPSVARMLGREPPVEPLAERRASLLVDAARSANGASANGAERLAFAEWRAWSDEDLARVSRRNPRYDFTGLARDLVSVRSDRFKLVRTGDGRETLFDLSADPSEERDASAEHPADAARLRAALDGAVASWRSPDASGDGELSAVDADEIERHLAELGYI
jgi:arylsulfatase A-like enzyme